jgi:hypothetical protein
MVDELAGEIDAIGRSDARAVLIRGEGENFSFGGDIMPWPDASTRELRTRFERCMAVFNQFERIPLAIIAAIQGLCFGGGLELAVMPPSKVTMPRVCSGWSKAEVRRAGGQRAAIVSQAGSRCSGLIRRTGRSLCNMSVFTVRVVFDGIPASSARDHARGAIE